MLINYHIGRLVLSSLCVGVFAAADIWWCPFCRLKHFHSSTIAMMHGPINIRLTLDPQLPFLSQCQRPSFTPIQNNWQNYSLPLTFTTKIIFTFWIKSRHQNFSTQTGKIKVRETFRTQPLQPPSLSLSLPPPFKNASRNPNVGDRTTWNYFYCGSLKQFARRNELHETFITRHS